MATDNWPADYVYISRRLTREIVDQDTAARRRGWRGKITASIPGTGISGEIAQQDVDLSNLFALARRATEVVSDLTGTIESPGSYIRATLEFRWDAVPVHIGWHDSASVDIACFFADAHFADIGGTFVGLVGSASNFLGRIPTNHDFEWTPSDALGLYRILDQASEPGDPKVIAELLDDDQHLSPQNIISQTATIYELARPMYGRGTVEILAKCHIVESDIDLSWNNRLTHGDSGRYGLAVLGAPIWVATPEPRRNSLIL